MTFFHEIKWGKGLIVANNMEKFREALEDCALQGSGCLGPWFTLERDNDSIACKRECWNMCLGGEHSTLPVGSHSYVT